MRLLIDIGNTRLKWALLLDGKLEQQGAFVYQKTSLSEQLSREWSALGTPQGIFMVSVAAGDITQGVFDWAAKRWDCPLEKLHSGKRCGGVVNGYSKPECLGVDRWAAIVGAFALVGNAVCVVDCGTALTIDVVDSDGSHLGGLIVPGQAVMHRSLRESTAGLQVSEVPGSASLLGTDTTSCIFAGSTQASVGLIERMVLQMQHQLDDSPVLVLTGGGAEALSPWLTLPYRYESDLVLQGIVRIMMEQRG